MDRLHHWVTANAFLPHVDMPDSVFGGVVPEKQQNVMKNKQTKKHEKA